jgi:isopenicillin N synthase-like dioxygenase
MSAAGEGPVLRDVLIIDISDFENRKHEIGRQLYHASHNVGFFYIKGHGVPTAEVESIFKSGEKFLDLPTEVKEKHVWIPDRYLGWRSQTNLESVTGALVADMWHNATLQ